MQNYNKIEFIDNLSKRLSQYESVRKNKIKEMILSEIVSCLIFSVSAYFLYKLILLDVSNNLLSFLVSAGVLILGLAAFLSLIYVFITPHEDNKDFKKEMKGRCTKDILNVFNLKTIRGNRISESTLRESNLFSEFNEYTCDDVIEGNIDNIPYKISEIELRRVTHGKHRTDFQAFKGVAVELPSNKPVKAHTLVTSKGDLNKRNAIPKNTIYFIAAVVLIPIIIVIKPLIELFKVMSKLDTLVTGNNISTATFAGELAFWEILFICGIFALLFIFVKRKNLKKAKLESVTFDKAFEVHTEDQTEGRYLVTPVFMERLVNFRTSFGTKNIKCAFFDNKILFAIETNKDLFEVCDLYKTMGNKKLIEDFCDEILSIQNIISHFKLNERTGL